jgi:hypothetical protein
MRHRLSPLPFHKISHQNQSSSQKSQDSKRGKQIGSLVNAKAAMVKSMMPKLSKSNGGGVELSVPKLNINLNLVSKLKTSRDDASRLLSKVPGTSLFYKKSKTVADSADAPDVFINDENKMKAPKISYNDRKRTFSKDDSSLDESFEMTDSELEKEVVLDSCGILATSAKQILESPQYSIDESDALEGVQSDIGSSTDTEKDLSEPGKIVFDIDRLPIDNNATKQESMSPEADKMDEGDGRRESNASFKCFCTETEECPHKGTHPEEDVWIKRTDLTEGKPTKNLDLDLGQKRVVDNSEADKILSKYSRSKQALSHPSMRNSMSDSAIATKEVTVAFTNVSDESPKAVLECDFEANPTLHKKLPNLLQSAKMPRKSHRIYDSLKQHIEKQLGDQTCQSTIIFI